MLKRRQLSEVAHQNEEVKFFSKEFANACAVKLAVTIISVKVWGVAICFTVPTILLIYGFIDPESWVSGFTIVPGIIFSMREVFKIANIWDTARKYVKGEFSSTDTETEDDIDFTETDDKKPDDKKPSRTPRSTKKKES